ncbi:uncharacterized protein [Primulina eburnea]|uniref:uncharacterized protein n=1 Tax=Primulina eburnea TaxID=1245227 RepID=UPI003C6CA766
MSSEMFVYENSILTDPFFPFTDSSAIDSHLHLPSEAFQQLHEYQAIPENDSRNPVDETNLLNEIASVLFSSSPPSFKLENLSLTKLRNEGRNSVLDVKTEECGLRFDANAFLPQNIDESAVKFMQRSYSSNSFVNNGQNSSFRARLDSVSETQNLQNQMLSPPDQSSIFASGQMRRVCSTGDLQNVKTNHMAKTNVLISSPLSAEKSLMEEASFKIGRYSAEERKERIDRYKAKRTQRNFNKTIKYACRKTLADNRLRIRGRFARNDEGGEIPKASMFHRYEDEEYFWNDGFNREDEEGIDRVGSSFDGLDAILLQTQYENYNHRLITSCREQIPRSVQFK